MRKCLIALVCGLLAVCACHLEGSFTTQNSQDVVTISGGKLVNDNGVVYTVSEKAADTPELEEGKRYLLIFNILDKYYNIAVTSVVPVEIVTPTLASETEVIAAHDPVQVQFNWIGPQYLDLGLSHYYVEGSDCAHAISARYSLSDDKKTLNLFLYHDGNDENPSARKEEELKQAGRVVSIPINEWKPSVVTLTLDILGKDDDGKNVVERKTYSTADAI